MNSLILRTERLNLRKMNPNDVTNLMEIFSDPKAMKYYPSTKNVEQTIEWIEWTMNNYTQYGVGLWIVEDKETGEFLGQCGIVPQEIDGAIEMEIGYLFARRVWGNGYATESALACKKYGFEQMKFSKMISLIDIKNLPSIQVARRIGMNKEKRMMKWGKEIFVYSVFN
ncbi:GNAT family N-acetyltransferase [Thermoflavimicrobium daqui]|jgi:RimJ/RimL family protein N-acetyltransferase|uniref:GNAT family N-acetyltransferase n=1 Tax=Thermoflavimicrobium daqui TaxID=2137476 RepID=A0A364K2Q9_9BACL|nr:GNAT family N-acetyltransferase [Thermoflavimicrobium daqui]RAL22686.1 GNAT family N-acetyltransferase [Thermoflavimicrobium daqui]